MSERRPTPVALRRVSTVEALVDAIRERVLSGALPGGTPLREEDLRASYGVSRHTVRTGLLALAHEGLVRVEPNRGATVRALTAADVDDLYNLRAILETAAVRATTGDGRRLDDARNAVGRLRQIADDAPWGAVRDADLAFHQALVDAAGSTRMSQAFRGVVSELRLGFVQLRFELEDHSLMAEQHEQILTKVERGQVDDAVELLSRHIDDAHATVRATRDA